MLPYLSTVDVFDDYKNIDAIKNMLAVLLIKVILADEKKSIEEEKKLLEFYQQNFQMSVDEVVKLFIEVKNDNREFDLELQKLDSIFEQDHEVKSKILHYINSVIVCDGIVDKEYAIFEEIKGSVQ
ncbi:hypothetical protein GJV85_08840 [Sulfurimonas aquatica]|uniref:Co-chaperone DjlA N-terminal domain-containing protein n=1 Tax=Sulfurimonas aquatica TaxID=2672570 RepID=A0A975B0X8_9BACT|nr:TerB family tellurite resistance protein [Sulfurimonas aquatica]QSZ42214.1 hypothetical protein GJV85_08840 [Sulfurimonas aquatica]